MKSRRNTTTWLRGLASLAGVVTSAGLLTALPAHATTATATASTQHADPRRAAVTRAEQTGKPVQVDQLTTANSITVANPNGSLTVETTVEPTRMKAASGNWVNLDATLVRRANGSITTTATPDSLTLSGGGTGPVISVADHAGHSLGLTLPVALPAPALHGASATYAGIYPGIDLTVTAQPTGAFSEVFTIADAAAARAAGHLRFGTVLRNLTLSKDSLGALRARDSKTGAVVMTAPAAALWDSGTQGTTATRTSTDPYFKDARHSSAAGPGLAAHVAPLGTTLGGGGLTLSANLAALGAHPVYPLYADPSWTEPSASGAALDYDEVQASCPSYTNYDSVTDLGVGYNEFQECVGVYRSFMLISLGGLSSSDDISNSTFKITSDYSADNSCDEGSQVVDLDWTGGIDSATDWSNQPGIMTNSKIGNPMSAEKVETDGNSVGGTCAGGVAVNFPVTGQISYFVSQGVTSLTLGMYGDESVSTSLERFNVGTASLVTSYDLAPGTPTKVAASPAPVRNGTPWACGGSAAPGYLPITNVSGENVATLSATATSPVSSAQMYGVFTLTNTTTGAVSTLDSSGYVTSGGTVSVKTPALVSGDKYTWSVYITDQYLSSPASQTCAFIPEQDPPGNPTITSADYPAEGSGSASTLVAGDPGTFTLTSTDPSGGPGLAGFYYSLNSPVPASGATSAGLNSGSSTTATVTLTPGTWGTNVLYAQARDAAGNVSAQTSYTFYVPWNPGSATVAGGSVNGTTPGLVVTDSSGNLVEYPGNASPGTAPVQLSAATDSPAGSGSTWNNFLVTHYGSYTEHNGFDDLWALDTSTHQLYLVENNQSATGGNYQGTTVTTVTKADVLDDELNTSLAGDSSSALSCYSTSSAPTSCSSSSYDNTDWSGATQIVAAPDLYAASPEASSLDMKAPGLLTVENGSLWYYQGQSSDFYLGTAIQLGTSGWNAFTVLAPGTVNGSDVVWARDNATGVVYQYPITYDSSGYPESLGTPTSGSGTAVTVPLAGDLTSTQYPAVYATDLHGTGDPDLIGQTANGVLTDWPGTAATSAGLATFGNPVALGNDQPTTGVVSFASDGTTYPSGSTWSNSATTMSFAQGVLTLTSTSTGALLDSYGSGPYPNAYLTLQTDGDLVIYDGVSGDNTALWTSGTGGNTSDTMQLLANGLLAIDSSGGTRLWTGGNTSVVSGNASFEVAGNTSSGALWTWSSAGGGQIVAQGAEAGTSPAIAALSTGGYEVAWAASGTDDLYVSGPGGTANTGIVMDAKSSPSITATASGGFEVAYQATDNDLCVYGGIETGCFSLGMDAGSSPSITTLTNGQIEAAFEANTSVLWYANQEGAGGNTNQGMDVGTNPSITALSGGAFEAVFQANNNNLYTDNSSYSPAKVPLGMHAGTSPSVIAYGSGVEAAFTANTSIMWATNTMSSTDTGDAAASTSSPDIVAISGGYEVAWTGSNSDAYVYSSATGADADLGQALSAGSSPAIAGASTVIG